MRTVDVNMSIWNSISKLEWGTVLMYAVSLAVGLAGSCTEGCLPMQSVTGSATEGTTQRSHENMHACKHVAQELYD